MNRASAPGARPSPALTALHSGEPSVPHLIGEGSCYKTTTRGVHSWGALHASVLPKRVAAHRHSRCESTDPFESFPENSPIFQLASTTSYFPTVQ